MGSLRCVTRRAAFLSSLGLGVVRADVAPPVVKVDGASLDGKAIERRLAELPPFQLAALGPNPRAIRKAFLERILIPELLYSAEARRLNLAASSRARDHEREILRRALLSDLEKEELETRPIGEDELRRHYAENRSEFSSPEKIRLWRIVVATRERALAIIADAEKTDGLQRWRAAARDFSLDQATKLRGGDVGFVTPDGATDVPRVRIAPEIFRAVQELTDGELSSEPLEHDGRFYVLWRRGTRPAVHEPFAEARERIRSLLVAERVEKATRSLLARLRKSYLRKRNDAPLENLRVPGFDALPPAPKPPARAAKRGPAPENTDFGPR